MKPPDGVRIEVLELEPEAGDAAYRSTAKPKRRVVIEREWVDGTAGLDGMLGVFVSGAGASVVALGGLSPLALLASGALAVGGGSKLLTAARKLFNRTRIVVDGDTLSVKHGPLPVKAIDPIPVASITRVFADAGAVIAVVDGKPMHVVDALAPAQAVFIADRLVDALDVTA